MKVNESKLIVYAPVMEVYVSVTDNSKPMYNVNKEHRLLKQIEWRR